MSKSARDILDEIKVLLNIKTDQELAETLGVGYHAMVAWLQRDKIPSKWMRIIDTKINIKNETGMIVGINNGNMTINTSTFNHSDQIRDIIELLKYAPPGYLDIIKTKLEEFKKFSEE